MTKEFIGTIHHNQERDRWSFETKENSFSEDIPAALDELLDDCTCAGEKYKITIEKIA